MRQALHWMSRSSGVPRAASEAVLGEACALLAGRAIDRYGAKGVPIPPWAWMNALAHLPPDSIEAVAAGYPDEEWSDVTMQIASELSRLEPAEVVALRAAVFVPAELEALAGPAGTPDALLRDVRRHLETDGLPSPGAA